MTTEEKIAALEEMFEAETGTIMPETRLEALPWDSMAMLSLIALVNERCGKRLKGADVRAFVSVQDILNAMG